MQACLPRMLLAGPTRAGGQGTCRVDRGRAGWTGDVPGWQGTCRVGRGRAGLAGDVPGGQGTCRVGRGIAARPHTRAPPCRIAAPSLYRRFASRPGRAPNPLRDGPVRGLAGLCMTRSEVMLGSAVRPAVLQSGHVSPWAGQPVSRPVTMETVEIHTGRFIPGDSYRDSEKARNESGAALAVSLRIPRAADPRHVTRHVTRVCALDPSQLRFRSESRPRGKPPSQPLA